LTGEVRINAHKNFRKVGKPTVVRVGGKTIPHLEILGRDRCSLYPSLLGKLAHSATLSKVEKSKACPKRIVTV
jgi:hypothetical protein